MAGDTLEPDAPNRLAAAVVAAHIFVSHVLVHLIHQLEEFTTLMTAHALQTEVVVGLALRLEPFPSR